jgi:pilus assembly protein FimV
MSALPSGANSVLGTDGGRSIDTGSSFQSNFSQGSVGKIDAEEIDPVAEADVYMAYGRDAQAEEILKDALAKDPTRQPIRVKLLEIYANRKDARAFESAANELHAATGGTGADWQKVAALGLTIDPANPLYGGKPQAPAPAFGDTTQFPAARIPEAQPDVTMHPEAPLNIDFDIGTATAGAAPISPDINLDAGAPSSAEPAAGLDFDLGLGGDKPLGDATIVVPARSETPLASEPSLGIDFDLPVGDKPALALETVTAVSAPELGAIDFDIGAAAAGEEKTEVPKAQSVDLNSISLDLGAPGGGNGPGGAPDARWQEVATKLDLAKAYEEMGDKDGARELLNEVMKEGDTAQQQQAQTMLQALT